MTQVARLSSTCDTVLNNCKSTANSLNADFPFFYFEAQL